MGWFEDQQGQQPQNAAAPGQPPSNVTAPGGQPNQNGYRGADAQARVTALYQQILGRAPTARELAGWGNDIDEAYLGRISNALQTSTEGQQYRTTSTQARITSMYQELVGRPPTAEELRNYGTNIDDRYLNTIRTNLANSEEARNYAANPRAPAATTPTTPTAVDWSTKDYSDVANVKAYAASRGKTMSDETAQYWADKYNSPDFAGDRAYYFTRLGQDPLFGDGGSGGGMDDLIAPWTGSFTYDDFKAPTQADLLASPGFQSSLDRASNILQRSAAAKGSLLSGSTAQALSDQTADLTTQGYGNLYNQNAQTYQANRANAFGSYQDKESTFYNNQNNAYAKLMGMAALNQQDTQSQRQTNLGYAQIGANAYSNGAAQYNGLMTGGANAAASGIVGAANPYASLYGSASQIPAWLLELMRRSGSGSSSGGGSNYGAGTSGGYYGP